MEEHLECSDLLGDMYDAVDECISEMHAKKATLVTANTRRDARVVAHSFEYVKIRERLICPPAGAHGHGQRQGGSDMAPTHHLRPAPHRLESMAVRK